MGFVTDFILRESTNNPIFSERAEKERKKAEKKAKKAAQAAAKEAAERIEDVTYLSFADQESYPPMGGPGILSSHGRFRTNHVSQPHRT